MPLDGELKNHYDAVLHDLEAQRTDVQQQVSTLQARLNDLHHSISTISKCLIPDTASSSPLPPSRPASDKYAFMSVRWAILDLLSDSQPKTTPEIAEALIAAGVKTRAANFANNVSAVLSTAMRDQHAEVRQVPDGKWELTEKGKDASDYIRSTPRFRSAVRGRPLAARF
ncbi:MAG TPA: hypothetical protein VNX26_01285 [Candidatus Acidoferrum sp.]|jgi:hypothetical protein|nr:hypothetical protein [Candidatus Acidoferrum sp.]